MKNNQFNDEACVYYERTISLIVAFSALTISLDILSYLLIADFNPWGIILAIPAVVFLFQLFWFLVNPHTIVYENRLEIQQSWVYSKTIYFIDLKAVGQIHGNGLTITYNDGEEERITLVGMRKTHQPVFRNKFNEMVCKSLVERD